MIHSYWVRIENIFYEVAITIILNFYFIFTLSSHVEEIEEEKIEF